MKRLSIFPILFLTALCWTLNASAADAYFVNNATVSGNAVNVSVTAQADCAAWGAAYDANGAMTEAQCRHLEGSERPQEFALSFGAIPEQGYVKVFLLDENSLLPLSSPFDSRYRENVHAILYGDGTLVFQHGDAPKAHGKAVKTYALDMKGNADLPPWYADRESVEREEFADKIQPTSLYRWFADCVNLKEIRNLKNLDTSRVTNMMQTFYRCQSLETLNLETFDTSHVA